MTEKEQRYFEILLEGMKIGFGFWKEKLRNEIASGTRAGCEMTRAGSLSDVECECTRGDTLWLCHSPDETPIPSFISRSTSARTLR